MYIRQFFSLVILSALFLVSACKKNDTPANNVVEPDCEPVRFASTQVGDVYIVLLKSAGGSGERVAKTLENARVLSSNLLNRYRIPEQQMEAVLNTIHAGFIARLTRTEALRLQTDADVEIIERDRVIALGDACFTVVSASSVQWGVRRTGADNGTGKRVWIIDTGVDTDHPDLNVDKTLSKCFITNETSVEDENGHGTHVAGIIGALNNSSGVLGVASGTSIIALKALNNDGEGNTSALIRALNYVGQIAKAGEVVNMSLGTDTISNALDNAVRTLADRGILFSVAAGNEGKKAILCSPARVNHPNVFTVSAIDSLGRFADFSNFGNDAVDLAAPGVRIVSTYTEGRYARLSGTSMAAPHVTGILLTRGTAVKTNGVATNDPDGTPDPIASF